MSVDVRVKKIVEKNEEIDKGMERAIQLRMEAVAAAITRSLDISDPKIATWLSTRLAELALVLQHAPPQFSAKVILTLLDILPEHVGAEVVKYYVDRIDKAYKTISQLAAKLAPKTSSIGGHDPLTQVIYMLAEQYISQQLGGKQQQPQLPPPSPAPIPEELKRIIDQLDAAENKGTNN